jgi:hypothetical protein
MRASGFAELVRQQAARAATLLAGEPIGMLVTSDAHRALTIAQTVGGTLYILVALLSVAIGPEVLGNAQSLRFERDGPTWTVRTLVRNVDGGAPIA